jgi:hypothetical protein
MSSALTEWVVSINDSRAAQSCSDARKASRAPAPCARINGDTVINYHYPAMQCDDEHVRRLHCV